MNSADWGRLSRLFREALASAPEARRQQLSDLEAEDPALARRLALLLEEWEEGDAGAEPPLSPGPVGDLLTWIRPEPDPGDMVGRYTVTGVLGRGGAGAVYLARDPVLERDVALKFLPARLALAEGLLKDDETRSHLTEPQRRRLESHHQLLLEARAASALDHPHIATIYEVDQDEKGRPFMAMAAYPGGSLRDRLNRGPLPVAHAVEVARQVADALAAAHSAGILHRDVKPENVVFDGHGRAKVVDFGIAWMEGRERATDRSSRGGPGSAAGTAAYMAPERLDGAEPDESADIWAASAVLYEMLTGRLPWPAGSREELRRAMRSPPPSPSDPDPEIPEALSELVLAALSEDPAARPRSAAAFRDALSGPGAAAEGSLPWWRRRRGAGLAAVAVAALLVTGAALGQSLPRVVEARGQAGDAFPAQGRILVADFQAGSDVGDLGLAAREALVVDLQQSPHLLVTSRGEVTDLLMRMGLPPDAILRGPLAREVAERLGAGAVVEGTVTRAGSRVLLSARGIEPVGGGELFAVRTAAAERRILGAVEQLSREVRGRLGEAAESLAKSRPLPQVTTASVEALRLYAQAEQAHVRDPPRAARLLESAVELDPGFAMAHRLAAVAALGNLRYSEVAEHLTLAWEHRNQLPEVERWHLEAVYASEVLFDPGEAERIYERILAGYPGDIRAAVNLGSVRISWRGDPAGGWKGLQDVLARDEANAAALMRAVHTAEILGLPGTADSLAARAEEIDMLSLSRRWPALSAFARGRVEEALTGCAAWSEMGVPPMTHASDDELCGSMAVAAGAWDEAEPRLFRALETYARDGRHRNVAHVGQSLVMAAHYRGDTAEVERRLRETIRLLPPEGFPEPDRFITRTNLQVQAVLVGRMDLVPEIGARYPPYPRPDHWFGRGGETMVEAALAIGAGDGPAALALLETAFPPGYRAIGWRIYEEVLLALALELTGDLDGARAAWYRAAEPGWLTFPFLTKDRILRPLVCEGAARTGGTCEPGQAAP